MPRKSAERPRRRVLLVEDHDDSASLLSMFLTSFDCDVTVVGSVREAIAALSQRWDVVLSDLGLPDGSGLTVAREARLRARPPGLLVALSGYGSEQDIAGSRSAGFDHHLVKPVNLQGLLQILERSSAARLGLTG